MGYFIGLPSELDAVKKGVDWMLDEEDDYDTVSADDLGPDFDPDEYADRDDVEVVRDETRDGHRYVAFEPQSDEARRMLEPANSKPEGSSTGGENMTEDAVEVPVAYDGSHADHEYGALEVDVREAGGREYLENSEEYGEFEEAPIAELGAAEYIEEAVTSNEELDVDELAGYIAQQDEFNFDTMIAAKADMGGRNYDAFLEGVDRVVSEVNELTDDLEATGAIYQALAEERIEDVRSANQAIKQMGERLGDVRRDSDYLENVADLEGAAQDGREAQEEFEEAEQIFEDL